MRKSKYRESQIMTILKQNEGGVSVPDLCRERGMIRAELYNGRSKYVGMDASMMKRMKELKAENKRLKKIYAEQRIKADIRQAVIEEKL
jgi:putative transposase